MAYPWSVCGTWLAAALAAISVVAIQPASQGVAAEKCQGTLVEARNISEGIADLARWRQARSDREVTRLQPRISAITFGHHLGGRRSRENTAYVGGNEGKHGGHHRRKRRAKQPRRATGTGSDFPGCFAALLLKPT